MLLSRSMARFNRVVTNPVARLWAGWAPTWGIIEHVGRTSGTEYRTPLTVFGTESGYVVLLGYGPNTQWVKNVVAAGGARLRRHGRTVAVTDPRIVTKAEAAPLIARISRLHYRYMPFDTDALVLTRAR